MHCDLNCDMGEGIGNDEALMPYISSANIACGYHAGDAELMEQTVLLALKFGVAIGAHPSFPDKENFGRTPMHFSPQEVYDFVTVQIKLLHDIAGKHQAVVHHVKPHGALYNMAAKDADLATAIAEAVKACNPGLILYGLSSSCMIEEARRIGLQTASEVFADRTYQDDRSLTPRTNANALIDSTQQSVKQVLQMLKEKSVTTITGKQVPIVAETICLHGDGPYALSFAKSIFDALQKEDITVSSIL